MTSKLLTLPILLALAVPSHAVNDATADTSKWKTYSSAAYGFKFKYPPELQARELYKLEKKSIFYGKARRGVFSVSLLYRDQYTGFSIVVEKKGDIQFRTNALAGFYIYEPHLNAWLGYNPVTAEYGGRQQTYFYLGGILCEHVDSIGPDKIPSYGTAQLVKPADPKNDVVLSRGNYGYEIPREETHIDLPITADMGQLKEDIRDTFQLLLTTEAVRAECTTDVFDVAFSSLPKVSADSRHPNTSFLITLDKPLPPDLGIVFFINQLPSIEAEKIIFELPVADLSTGDRLDLAATKNPDVKAAIAEKGTLHAFFYKKVFGRKVLLGDTGVQSIPLTPEPSEPVKE